MLQPHYYRKKFAESTDQSGGNLLLRWQRTFSATSGLEVQGYYDRTEREEYAMHQKINIYDFNLQHHFQATADQEIIWGMGYRFYRDDLKGSRSISFSNTDHRNDDLFNAFIQDDIAVIPRQLHLILGSKLEHNDYTGYEIQPNGRLLWTPNENNTFWGAISRAVRTPSRVEHDSVVQVVIPLPPVPGQSPPIMQMRGSDDYDSEELLAYELGYRFLGIADLSVDFSAYYSDYDNLQTIEETTNRMNKTLMNLMSGSVCGFETVIDWQPLDWWRLQATYAYENVSLELDGNSQDYTTLASAEGDVPRNLASLRSSMDLPADMELDIWWRYVDALRTQKVDSYINLDIRVAWQVEPGLEFSLTGQNLLDNEHPEYNKSNMGNQPTEVIRSIYIKATWSL
jgi:iron complex outermembrane receptor protein